MSWKFSCADLIGFLQIYFVACLNLGPILLVELLKWHTSLQCCIRVDHSEYSIHDSVHQHYWHGIKVGMMKAYSISCQHIVSHKLTANWSTKFSIDLKKLATVSNGIHHLVLFVYKVSTTLTSWGLEWQRVADCQSFPTNLVFFGSLLKLWHC